MNLILGISGATGAYAAQILAEISPWPLTLVASEWGKKVYERECESFNSLTSLADKIYQNHDLGAPIASGSVPTLGMVILPCSCHCMASIAAGLGDTLITRAAHCTLKEKRKLVLCVRESPWTMIDFENAAKLCAAGATVMPLSPPFYLAEQGKSCELTAKTLLTAYVERVLAIFGKPVTENWETLA